MIAVIKYNAGNVTSVLNALDNLKADYMLTDNQDEIRTASKVLFPGVGEASTAMHYLKERGLDTVIQNLKQPFLGVCLGLQLMCKRTEEGDTDCLGVFDTTVKKFPPNDKVPHMGWNNFTKTKSPLFKGIKNNDDVYFVHSYYAETCEQTIATTFYQLPFSSALQKDNFYAVQFHPEKSADIGYKIIQNFLDL
jgi:glutamine amidotransferase